MVHENALFILFINIVTYAVILIRIWQDEDEGEDEDK
jgi:hypothetical protein